ncbi:hypothetical protein PVAP13_4NG232533 [Panicum virgatum]|uniref:Uncharacterized protein n=1 Tax=Panicum virgatum TaxID=38727 RepID=A0A8T0T3J7_PANVG|nr:hypothetical protein PVAP13_4NG232533 [Panicum virgatum]
MMIKPCPHANRYSSKKDLIHVVKASSSSASAKRSPTTPSSIVSSIKFCSGKGSPPAVTSDKAECARRGCRCRQSVRRASGTMGE